MKTKQVRPQRRLLDGESVVEGDHISPLESHRQPLEHVCCFPGVFSDGCHSSAQLLQGQRMTAPPAYYYYYIVQQMRRRYSHDTPWC